jgi:group I intron endonuclease
MIGIYRIKNLVNDKCYYGSSKNIEKRWRIHKNHLNGGKHHNIPLQRAWNKYGENNFSFEVIEECNETILLEREQHYLDLNPEYNIGLKSSGGDNLTKNPNKEENVHRMTQSVRKRYELMPEDEKKEKHSQPMDKNPNWKGGVTYVYCECGKRIGYGHTNCNKCRPRSSENNPFFGKQHSEETKNKISESRKGSYHGEQNIPIVIDGVEYRSAGEASKILNIPMVTIRWRVLSKNKKFDNYKYKD